ncbi:S8 family serine peptidase [uncultured Tateyamaria sp.]|uniref:S8 family serine peptidase n=1 Tax=uncultured Tateyamaria sp. TaxID=455651 RepID=UPI002635335F|nr:S8 family serine peptidase [uncultured Tateyamaria sp.]
MAWRENAPPPVDTLALSDFPQAHWWWLLDTQSPGRSVAGDATGLLLSAASLSDFKEFDAFDEVTTLFQGFGPDAAQVALTGGANRAFLSTLSAPAAEDGPSSGVAEIDQLLEVLTGNEDLIVPILPGPAQCDPTTGHDTVELAEEEDVSVIVGIIDDGIAIANSVFRVEEGGAHKTRVVSLWQQDAKCAKTSANQPFGRILRKDKINQALEDATVAGRIDEVKFYRDQDLGMGGRAPGSFRNNATHGVHVAGLAAGTVAQSPGTVDCITESPEKFPIVAVNLPTSIVSDTSGSFMATAVILGLQHILETADAISGDRPVPVVINLSFALLGSGMGGANLIAQYIDQAVEAWQLRGKTLIVVLPAGNNFQDDLVGTLTVPPNSTGTAEFEIDYTNETSTFVEFVVENTKSLSAASDVRLELRSSEQGVVRAAPAGRARLRSSFYLEDDKSQITAGVYYGFHLDGPMHGTSMGAATGREIITLALPPNRPSDGGRPLGVHGKWTATLHNFGATQANITVRILRNDDPVGDNARQTARLLDRKDGDHPTCRITQDYTLNAIAKSAAAVVVGASYVDDDEMAPYSSSGPIVPLGGAVAIAGVDLHAPADRNAGTPGLLGPGAISASQNGRDKAMSGTSVAAPLVSRWLVNHLSANNTATHAEAVQCLMQAATRAPLPNQGDGTRTGIGGLPKRLAGTRSR